MTSAAVFQLSLGTQPHEGAKSLAAGTTSQELETALIPVLARPASSGIGTTRGAR